MSDDVNKLMGRMTKAPEEKDELRSFLEASQPALEQTPVPAAPPQPTNARHPFEAQALKARQDASETMLGQMFGIQGLNDEEKQTYTNNVDPDIEQAFDRGSQMGLGMGSIGSVGSKAATIAQKDALQSAIQGLEAQYGQAVGKEAVKIGQNIVRFKDKLSKMLGD